MPPFCGCAHQARGDLGTSSGSECTAGSCAGGSAAHDSEELGVDESEDCDEEHGEEEGIGGVGTVARITTGCQQPTVQVDLIALTRDWAALDGAAGSDSSCSRAPTRVGHRTRYRNMALAIEAAEKDLSRQGTREGGVSTTLQAASGLVIFAAVNLRIAAGLVTILSPYGPCRDEPLTLEVWFWMSLGMDLFFIAFQIACVRRDRTLSKLRLKLLKDRNYGTLILFHIYTKVVLGMLSGWQILRSIRQLRNSAYRDSFFVELNDPSMVSDSVMRMPFFSSHLTFLFELPFILRTIHLYARGYWHMCTLLYTSAWLVNFQLVIIAVLTFDYAASRSIRDQYEAGFLCGFGWIHITYRTAEYLARILSIATTRLEFMQDYRLWVYAVVSLDYLIAFGALCWVSRTVSKRTCFMSIPLYGANLALFADEGGLTREAQKLSSVLDAWRLVVVAAASLAYFWQWHLIRIGCHAGNAAYEFRVLGSCGLMLSCSLVSINLRMWSIIGATKADADNELEVVQTRTACEYGSNLDKAYYKQYSSAQEAGGLAAMLFSKGVGDQFGSMMEIIWEAQDDLRLSRLEIVAKLGEGGFGYVCKVRDTRTWMLYALKLQRKDNCSSCAVREAQALHKVQHPFIVGLVRIFNTTRFYCILMELCEEDLNKRILECTAASGHAEGLPEEQVQHYAACIMLALEHLHDRAILFRDLKPENVLTTAVGLEGHTKSHAKLADFGLARSVHAEVMHVDGASVAGVTSAVGTPAFMAAETFHSISLAESPEQTLRLLASRDWYAFGCCLALMLLGERAGRVAQLPRRTVLLPLQLCDLRPLLRRTAEDSRGNVHALALTLALTVEVAGERGGPAEIRSSPFLRDAVAQAELLAEKFSAAAAASAAASKEKASCRPRCA